jgi:hypothetical protein
MKKTTVIQDETGMFDQNCELTLWPEDPVTKEHLEKYNQCHGDRGRFCSSGGGGGGGGGSATMPAQEFDENDPGFPESDKGPGTVALAANEEMAVRTYQGTDYSFINTWMRNPDSGGNQQDKDYYLRKADNIAKAIDKQPPLKGEEIVYRGLRTDKNSIKPFVKDAIIEDKAFMSTTTDREIAKNFGNTVLSIRVPKGTKALRMTDIIDNVSSRTESEMLLQRGTKLKITHVRQESGGFLGMGAKTYIDARVITDE